MTTEQRLARLEKENRWMKLGGAVLLLTIVAVLFVGAGQEKDKPKVLEEVRARMFVAVDEEGKGRAFLMVTPVGPSFVLMDKNGEIRVASSVLDDRASITMFDKAHKPRLLFDSETNGGPIVALFDKAGNKRAVLACDVAVNETTHVEHKYPESTLTLYDASGKVIFQAPK